MLNLAELDEFIESNFTRTAFRLETLRTYNVPTDGGDVARYLAGEPEPDMARKQRWLDHLAAEVDAGKQRSRVRVLQSPLSNYERYECEWGYAYNVVYGEDIRVLDLTERNAPSMLLDEDFWLLDEEHVLLMHYAGGGSFLGAEPGGRQSLEIYQQAAAQAWEAAVPFTDYWAAHPQYHRMNQVA